MQVETYSKNYKLESIETLPNDKFSSKLDQAIKNIIEKEGFIKYDISKKCISTNGGNYLGDLYEIDVKGKTVRGDKELNIFVKKIIDNKESVKVISVSDVYKAELFAYKQLSKIFEELQDDANIPLEERYKMVKVLEGTDADMLIMENLSKKGFKTYHRMDVVSLKFLELSVQNLARFHGLSFVIKEKYPDFFQKHIKSLDHAYVLGEDYKRMLNDIGDVTVAQLEDHYKDKAQKAYKGLFDNFVKYLKDETIKTCLCHGDYRPNNIMMKDENGVVEEIIPIDYQLIHYGCPVFDLLYLIYFCTDHKFRKTHLTNLKDLYYDTLENFLKYFNLDADAVYPRKEFERVFKEKIDFALLITLHLLPFFFVTDEDVPDISQSSKMHFKVDRKFKDRMQGVMDDFIELGII